MPSRLFMYYNQRVFINTINSNSGAFIRDGIKSLNKQGVSNETLWTYDDNSAFRYKIHHQTYANLLYASTFKSNYFISTPDQ
ncbi:MAG: hypothetical protein ABIR66_02295 [Saprospiraceae bacterium]